MSRPTPARKAVFHVLVATYERDAFVREVLKASPQIGKLSVRDKAFAQRLALGVVACRGTLDELLDKYIEKPSKVSPKVRTCLRMATFEILYMSTPDSAAVSQGVELVRLCAKSATGLANAVLHRIVDFREAYLESDVDSMVAATHNAGLPTWLASVLFCDIGANHFTDLAACQLEPAPIYVQTNSYHGDQLLDASDLGAVKEDIPGCYRIENTSYLQNSKSLAQTDCVVSDIAAQAIACCATREGTCLEIGAGRGTKTFHILSQAHRINIKHEHVALDLFKSKCELNCKRLKAGSMPDIKTVAGDARNLTELFEAQEIQLPYKYDTVFLDSPCSGTGTMRRHPEIVWRLTNEELNHEIIPLEQSLLINAAQHVAVNGELFYATCSVLSCENEQIIESFLESDIGQQFKLASIKNSDIFSNPEYAQAASWVANHTDEKGMFQSYPALHAGDGHFCARLRRIK